MTCAEVQDRLPDRAAGRSPARDREVLDRHLATCEECREMLATLELLAASRPAVPAGLEARIQAAVHEALDAPPARVGAGASPVRRPWFRPAWAIPAAAVLALAVGLPVVLSQDDGEPVTGVLALADGETGLWFDDDLMVAGAPALSELSDEALAELLEEFE